VPGDLPTPDASCIAAVEQCLDRAERLLVQSSKTMTEAVLRSTENLLLSNLISRFPERNLIIRDRDREKMYVVRRPRTLQVYQDNSGQLLLALSERVLLTGKRGTLWTTEIAQCRYLRTPKPPDPSALQVQQAWETDRDLIDKKVRKHLVESKFSDQVDVFYDHVPSVLEYDKSAFKRAYPLAGRYPGFDVFKEG